MITTSNNNLSVYIANISVVDLVFFLAFHDTAVRSSDLIIRTIAPPTVSTERYRVVMITIISFRRILSLSSSSSISLSNLTTTVAANFSLPIGLVEREVERIVDSICHVFPRRKSSRYQVPRLLR